MSKAAVRWCLLMTFLLTLCACSGATVKSGSESTLDSGAPSTENTTATEQPLPPKAGNPGIPVASLPIGGADTTGGPCVQVGWSGGAIPEGIGAGITSVNFTPKAYQVADKGCPTPLCIGHVIVASETTCWQGVSPTDASQKGRSKTETVNVSVTGEVLCSDLGSDPCKAFAETVGGQPPSMTVPLPIAPPNPGTGTATGPDSGAGSGSGATTEPQATSASPGG